MPRKGRKEKQSVPEVVRPEEPFMDEAEVVMLWEKVLHEEELAHPSIASAGINAGPQTRVVPRGSLIPVLARPLHDGGSDARDPEGPTALQQEQMTQAALDKLHAAEDEDAAVAAAIDTETGVLRGKATELTELCTQVEMTTREERGHHISQLTTEQHTADAQRYALEDERERLLLEQPAVEELLTEKAATLAAIEDRNTELARLSADHTTSMTLLATQLAAQRRRLDETMSAKLKRTTEDMQRLSEEQALERERRAAADLSRLTAEAGVLEAQAEQCEARTSSLRETLDRVCRELDLEQGRQRILQRKASETGRTLRSLVEGVSTLDQAPWSSTVALDSDEVDDGDRAGAQLVDEQYADIVQLRADIAEVDRDLASSVQLLAQARRSTESSHGQPLTDAVLGAASDVGKLLQSSSQRSLDEATAGERAAFFGYLVRRWNNTALSQPTV